MDFFGFAVEKYIDKYHIKLVKSELSNNETESDELNVIIAYRMDIRIIYKQALLDKKYGENFYASSLLMHQPG